MGTIDYKKGLYPDNGDERTLDVFGLVTGYNWYNTKNRYVVIPNTLDDQRVKKRNMPLDLRIELTDPLCRLPYHLLVLKVLRNGRAKTARMKDARIKKIIRYKGHRHYMLILSIITARFLSLTSDDKPLGRRQHNTNCRIDSINANARIDVNVDSAILMRTNSVIGDLNRHVTISNPLNLTIVKRYDTYKMNM